ncbi:MAG: NFACT RNA binding domain-containing protein [Bacteroidota bacterium]|nr:NFACT RNA binding domain-containing protein [Bacteroidota bacterium]
MLNNYFTIREVANYLNENISGYSIDEIYTQEKNKLFINIINEGKKDSKVLEYSIEKGMIYLVLKGNYSKAKKNFANLLEEVYGKQILNIALYNDDRAIVFKLQDEHEIIFTFFSNKANTFIVKDLIVINSFKDKDDYYQKNISEVFPIRAKTISGDNTDFTIEKYFKQDHRTYGDIFLKEILFRKKLNGKELISSESKAVIEKELFNINDELKNPKYYLYNRETEFIFSLIQLKHLQGYTLREFENIISLTTEYLRSKFREGKIISIKQNKSDEHNKTISNLKKKIQSLNVQLGHCEDSESLKSFGNAILQNLQLIKKGDKKYLHETVEEQKIEIKLKDNLTPVENAQNYFDKYKKQKSSVDLLRSKIHSLEKEKIKTEDELQKINNLNDYKTLIKEEKKSEENKNDETSRFRKFKLNEKYEVWVGKDSASNDLLTTRHSAQNDLWFHVRGSSGSHTVLKVSNKKEDIPKEVILSAASIAAYYSKARKASSVPVAYCERKFVKKKKGFKEGSVVMEREKVISVKPSLPEN